MNAMFPLAKTAGQTVLTEYVIVGQRLETDHSFGTEYHDQALYRRIHRSDRGLC